MINIEDNILVCCSAGYNRSVHFKHILNSAGFTRVLTLGLHQTAPDVVFYLCNWAHKILLAGSTTELIQSIPEAFRNKVIHTHLGKDRWGWKNHDELLQKAVTKIDRIRRGLEGDK